MRLILLATDLWITCLLNCGPLFKKSPNYRLLLFWDVTPSNIPEEVMSQLHHGGSQKSHVNKVTSQSDLSMTGDRMYWYQSNLISGTCPVKKRRPWRSTSPSTRRLTWRRISSVEPRWWMTWVWSWWEPWWHRGPLWLALRCDSARNWPTRWWRSDQKECRSGWGSSPWNERTESRMPGESNFLRWHNNSVRATCI